MKITRLRIRNYKGLEDLDATISPAGALVHGDNAQGKTSLLNAIHAALEGRGISSDAIRLGASRADILVDTDDVSVKRVITPKTSSLAVERGNAVLKSPQTFLRELLGASSLDPMDLLTKKDKERTEVILKAVDVTVTVEQLRTWVPRLKDGYDCSGHGLVVVQQLHDDAYELRRRANAAAKVAQEEAARASEYVASLPPPEGEPQDVAPLETAHDATKAILQALQSRAKEAKESKERTASVRERIATVKAEAASNRERAATCEYTSTNYEEASRAIEETQSRIADLEECLESERANKARLEKMRDTYADALAAQQNQLTTAANLDGQAAELEATIKLASVEAPDEASLKSAEDAVVAALAVVEKAKVTNKRAFDLEQARLKEAEAKQDAEAKQAEADRLDSVVYALAKVAPAALLKASGGIPGLEVKGNEIWMDGKNLDDLSSAEQLRFAVEISKRANAKSKILVVDGLERVSPSRQKEFIAECIKDGWQLIATKVDDGALSIEAIQADEPAEVMP